jgi:cbb3-type cytochrome oxidase subunit 3
LPKEIVVLLVLLAVMVIGVLWYVIDRRAKNRAAESAQPPAAAPARP